MLRNKETKHLLEVAKFILKRRFLSYIIASGF